MSRQHLTIEMILSMPCFHRASLIAGRKGTTQPVLWAHILEVNDISALINGGELILTTGIGWKDDPQSAINLLRQLIENKASGLCIELFSHTTELPDQVIRIADEHNFPLIVFYEQVRFIDITKDIYDTIYYPEQNFNSSQQLIQFWNTEKLSEHAWASLSLEDNLPGYFVLVLGNINNEQLYMKEDELRWISSPLHSVPATFFMFVDRYKDTKTLKKRILNKIRAQVPSEATILFGTPFHTYEELNQSLTSLKKTKTIANYHLSKNNLAYEDLHIEKILLPIIQSGQIQPLVDEYLGDLIMHDQLHNTELILTLGVYLKCSLNKKMAADHLFIVRQTLYHRLSKIEELLGKDYLEGERKIVLEILLSWMLNDDGSDYKKIALFL
ncbi:PucR family transcriptional regulator [Halobacillus sp. Marseille-Q1614]|uniref:PucR family transcriptional regulator n=1 Tax=Halobacillus sp. Marseille-Q1614 TaxID=2709134 RepID=UPI00156EE5EF|nr:PucR family transcriptional regulator [Halobacillus sp. Marseille-Q1614]